MTNFGIDHKIKSLGSDSNGYVEFYIILSSRQVPFLYFTVYMSRDPPFFLSKHTYIHTNIHAYRNCYCICALISYHAFMVNYNSNNRLFYRSRLS